MVLVEKLLVHLLRKKFSEFYKIRTFITMFSPNVSILGQMNSVHTLPSHFLNTVFNPLTPELNPSAQHCLTRFLLQILLLEPCISLKYARKTNKYTNY
jgi:hypothetical protein